MENLQSQARLRWLKKRKKGISGTNVATLFGKNKYETPLELYLDKVSLSEEERADNPQMQAGRRLEPFLRKLFTADTDLKLLIPPRWKAFTGEHKFELATPDAFIIDDDNYIIGIAEFKTSSYVDIDEMPDSWFLQLMWYVSVFSADKYKHEGVMQVYKVHPDGLITNKIGYLKLPKMFKHEVFNTMDLQPHQMTALLSTCEFAVRDLPEITEEHIRYIRNRVSYFWMEYVMKRRPPKPTTVKDLDLLFPEPPQQTRLMAELTASSDIAGKLSRINELQESQKEIKEELEQLKTDVILYMGDYELLTYNDTVIATYKYSKPVRRFDSSKFKKEHPEMHQQYLAKAKTNRRFLIKTKEK